MPAHRPTLRSLALATSFLVSACGSSASSSTPSETGTVGDATSATDASDSTPASDAQAARETTSDVALDVADDTSIDAVVDVPADAIAATITVAPTKKLATIGADFAGLSYEKSHLSTSFFTGDNTALITMFQRLGPSLLRIGGNSVDHTPWSATGPGKTSGQVGKTDVDALAAFLKAAGWKAIYGVPYAGSTAANAASEAGYVAQSLGDSLYGFEIGNECDLYHSNGDEPTTFTYADFTAGWEAFRVAMLASAPGSIFTGPASATDYNSWTIPFGTEEGAHLQLLTQHWYRANGMDATSTIDLLLSPDPDLVTELQALATAASADHIAGGFRFAETNSFYNGGSPGISDGFGSGLWVLDYLFTQAQYGSTGINLHGGGDGTGYTPIADNGSSVVGPRPEYYGLAMFALATPGQMVDASLVTKASNLAAYAVTTSDGATNVVVINKSRTDVVAATIDFGDAVTGATSILLTAPSLDTTTDITIGGIALGTDGSGTPAATTLSIGGTTTTLLVPSGSAVLVRGS